jgi:predicted nucleotidyltransferase
MLRQYTKIFSLNLPLSKQVDGLQRYFPLAGEIGAVLLVGSCSRGEATYRSDVDILVLLNTDKLTYGKVRDVRDRIEQGFASQGQEALLTQPLPVQFTVVLASAITTSEPGMKLALLDKVILADPYHLCVGETP